MRIVILHFQPLEKYPPILNLIRDIEREGVEKVSVLSTNTSNNWFKSLIALHRWGNLGSNKFTRYATYIIFNALALLYLLFKKPTKVVYYETLSCWSVYWYKKIRSKSKVFIHFHEYSSEEEKNRSSAYYKNLLAKEAYLLQKADWVSHTNEDRMRLFRIDYPFLQDKQCHIFPNYPPTAWSIRVQHLIANRAASDIVKLVYVGALGLQTTYIQELAEWIQEQHGKYSLDIYTDNIELEARHMLMSINSPYINLKAPIMYFELPDVLANYDIGLVLYKGVSLNHIYSVPNKIVEYLSCGLQVLCSMELSTSIEFKKQHNLTALHFFNFENLQHTSNLDSFLNQLPSLFNISSNIEFLEHLLLNES